MSVMRLLPLSFFAFCAVASPARAAVTGLINGNFETDVFAGAGGLADRSDITSWFESSTGSTNYYYDWLGHTTSAAVMGGNLTNVLGFSNTGGYVYQAIGTYTAGEQILFSGTALKRNTNGYSGLKVELLSGNFTGADGTALAGAGVTLLTTQTYTQADLGLGAFTGATTGAAAFAKTLDAGNSGVAGTTLWLRLSAPNSGVETFVDNLSVSSVPEPSAYAGATVALAASFAGMRSLRRRRRAV